MRNIVFFMLVLASGMYANGTIEVQDVGAPTMERKVLIATEPTEFKNALVTEIVKMLTDGNTYIKIVNHADKGLDTVDPRTFDAVLITNSGATAKVRPWVMTFLNRVASYDDNIILHTTQITIWTPPVQVDSVTSASDIGGIRRVAIDLVGRVRKLL